MAKKKLIILVTILIFAVTGYFALTQVSAYDNFSRWVLYTAQEGHFQVRFPRQPRHATTDIPIQSPTGIVRYNSYVAMGEDQTLYLLTTAIYPIAIDVKNARQCLQTFIQQLVGTSPETVILREQEVIFQNNPAVDFVLVNKHFCTYGRAILAGNTVFVLISSNASNSLSQKNFHTFADSLVIK